eukprot:4105964-Pyramimonas_sp.AAC.1
MGTDLLFPVGQVNMWRQLEADALLVACMTPMCKAFSAPRAANWGRMHPRRVEERGGERPEGRRRCIC